MLGRRLPQRLGKMHVTPQPRLRLTSPGASTGAQRRLPRTSKASQPTRKGLQAKGPELQLPPWPQQNELNLGTAMLGTFGFTAVAVDVFDAHSAHLLLPLDNWGHSLAGSIDPSVRIWLWDLAVSDLFITTGLLGWTAITLHAVLSARRGQEAAGPAAVVGLSWLFYYLMAGRVEGDLWLVGTLKELFHRARPSAIHHSMSFPSGHTTTATFLAATILFVFIPMLLYTLDPPAHGTGTSTDTSTNTSSSSQFCQVLRGLEAAAWPLFGAAWATTAVGRVLGDAHWTSDTLAGGFLSLAVTSVLAKLSRTLLADRASRRGAAAATETRNKLLP